ncbi:hypothetical protein WJX81_005461 [Elliptochloris bilobata]|uniref:F-box domain-containing protein n=1 Tax=Elliptochloris bilobata TaxID=381761 RepID=A0AAW1RT86_9CHLO
MSHPRGSCYGGVCGACSRLQRHKSRSSRGNGPAASTFQQPAGPAASAYTRTVDRGAFAGLPDDLVRRLLAEACADWPDAALWGLLAACRVCWRFREVLAAHPLPAVLRLGSESGLAEADAALSEAQADWLRALQAEHGGPPQALVLGTALSPKSGHVHVLLGFVLGAGQTLRALRAWPVRLAVFLNPEPAATPAPTLDLSTAKLTLLHIANPTPNPSCVDLRWLPHGLRSLELQLLHGGDSCTALVDLAEVIVAGR